LVSRGGYMEKLVGDTADFRHAEDKFIGWKKTQEKNSWRQMKVKVNDICRCPVAAHMCVGA
jgi:hypothetical protein